MVFVVIDIDIAVDFFLHLYTMREREFLLRENVLCETVGFYSISIVFT